LLPLGGHRRRAPAGEDHSHLSVHHLGGQSRQSIVFIPSKSILDGDISALDVADFTQASPECCQQARTLLLLLRPSRYRS
jgi:hypothetical protein